MKVSPTRAMVLAAGEGTRLRPLTSTLPKVLVPVNGVPALQYTLCWLKNHGVLDVVINLFSLSDQIRSFAGDGSRFGLRIVYSTEPQLLGTSGGVKHAGRFFDGPFFVVYGDVVTDLDLGAMAAYHHKKGGLATIALMPLPQGWEVGVVNTVPGGRITSFEEKPRTAARPGALANTGVYILEKTILDCIPDGFSDFGRDIFPALAARGSPLFGYCLKPQDYLLDIGTLDKYQRANRDAREGRLRLPPLVSGHCVSNEGGKARP